MKQDNASVAPLAMAVLISGGGTTLLNLLEEIQQGSLLADIKLVLSSNPKAGGLDHAAHADIPRLVRKRSDYDSPEAFSDAVFQPFRDAAVDLVVMGGFLKHVLIPEDFQGRVMNIHPALIPAFCGAGYYGRRVHEEVLAYGTKISGCTVHFVDNQYDHGPIILQRCVIVRDDDTPETLASRVFEQEREAYPEAIRLFAAGKLRIDGRRVVVG